MKLRSLAELEREGRVSPEFLEAARSLTFARVIRMNEDDAADVFRHVRWAESGGEPECPKCEGVTIYHYAARKLWKCAGCNHQFTLTSGTMFAGRKLPLQSLLLAIVLFLMGKKGTSSLQISRMMETQYKTVYVWAQKFREAIHAQQSLLPALSGEVEVDGAVFGGHIERFNVVDRRNGKILCRRRYGHRRTVVVLRQRRGRTLTWVGSKESGALAFVKAHVQAGTVIHTDGAHAWKSLQKLFKLMRVHHNVAFSKDGACTNRAESFFSLMRRKQMGVHHRMSGKYLALYAAEMAWRNDHNAVSEGVLAVRLLRDVLAAKPSDSWSGYSQGPAKRAKQAARLSASSSSGAVTVKKRRRATKVSTERQPAASHLTEVLT